MGNQDWRHYLNGLYLFVEDTVITSVATDAHRLAMATLPLNEGVQEQITGIVPRKSINEIGKLVGDSSENVVLKLGPSSIIVDISGTTFASKLIEGKFRQSVRSTLSPVCKPTPVALIEFRNVRCRIILLPFFRGQSTRER